MACCGQGPTPVQQGPETAQSGRFFIAFPDGTKSYYATELAARAANAKSGNRGIVRPSGAGPKLMP